ncbi:MAG TPA: hypothetical protein PKD32_09070 [Saprospiraceae bacterium]|nr:hypothetical protein [Saprospiraceae bacterium]
MNKILLFSTFIITLISCNPEPQSTLQEVIVGSWKDQGPYKIYSQKGTVIDTVYDKDIVYTFLNDGTYSITNELLVGAPKQGHYTINASTNKIDFQGDQSIIDTLGIQQLNSWQVINFSQSSLEVNYNFKQNALDSLPAIDITIYRKFIKL